MRKRILVTGATGYLGSSLVHDLISDYDLTVLKRRSSNTFRISSLLPQLTCLDIEDVDFSKLFKTQLFSGVIHCATNYGRDEHDLDDTIEANLILPLRLLKNAFESKLEFFINTDTVLDKRISYYSLSKAQFKDWFVFFSDKIKSINVELEHFYGRGDDPSKFVSKIVNDLVSNDVKSIDLTLGEQKRSFIYIDDVVQAFRLILQEIPNLKDGFSSFQVASKHHISIRNFVILAKELCGNTKTQLNFGALPYRKNEVMEVVVDLTHLEKLGWSEKTTIRQGLLETINFEKTKLKNHFQ
ncbi:MAG: NAD(P)-dependent oxidoreductase [Bdellovibrionaceae bacterium]|nr:NAD(P)-dependent oxidoreductase [Pseudobdellovibrionaceae bacterium]